MNKLGAWTTRALNAGGTLTIEPPMPGKAIFTATMRWPFGERVSGKLSIGIESALESLESALLEDAAKEMQESGAV